MKAIISKQVRIRYPEHFSAEEGSIVDDFCYFSTKVTIGKHAHIASGCSIAGGVAQRFVLGNFSSLSSGVKVWCTSNDFVNDIVIITQPNWRDIGTHPVAGDVIFEDFTAVGSNSVIMPHNHIPEGTVIGALSFVPSEFPFETWAVYAGIPIRKIKKRNRNNVLIQVEQLRQLLKLERK